MFRITKERRDGRVVLKLEGRVSAAALDQLDACWRAATDEPDAPPVWVDLSDASLIGTGGQDRLARMHRAGVRFLARGCFMREVVREILDGSRLCERPSRPEGVSCPSVD